LEDDFYHKTVGRIPVLIIIFFAYLLRVMLLQKSPDFHFDEPIYMLLSQNVLKTGTLSTIGSWDFPFFYHPPLFFLVQALWFQMVGQGLFAARLLPVLFSTATIGITYLASERIFGVKGYRKLLLVSILSVDNWSIFSSRLALMEPQLIFLSFAAIALYFHELERKQRPFAGILFGLAFVTKYLAIVYIITAVIYTCITKIRGRWRYLIYNLAITAVIAGTCSLIEYMLNPTEFLVQNSVQMSRSILGDSLSRGMYDIATAFKGFDINATFYAGTYIVTILGVIALTYRIAVKKSLGQLEIWGFTTIFALIIFRLRYPHYLTISILPLFTLFAKHAKKVILPTFLTAVIAVNMVGWVNRFVTPYDHALIDTAHYLKSLPSSTILCDEPVGIASGKTWYRITVHKNLGSLLWLKITHVVIQRSFLQPPPDLDPALWSYLQYNCTIIRHYHGIWYDVTVYETPLGYAFTSEGTLMNPDSYQLKKN